MQFKLIDEQMTVTGQIWPDDVKEIHAAGFRTIICNRPDNESPDQPEFEAVRAAAAEIGVSAHFIPVIPGLAGQPEVDAFRDVLATAEKPVLSYCRSGARSEAIYRAAIE